MNSAKKTGERTIKYRNKPNKRKKLVKKVGKPKIKLISGEFSDKIEEVGGL